LKGFFQGFLEFIYDTLLWFVGVIETVFEYLGDLLSGLWDLISETVLSLFDTVLEWIWYIGEWLWELMLSAFDWAVGLGLEFIQWILDKFPQLQLPAGFDEGVNHFIRFGMLLNEVIPVRETFMLFAIYIAILLIMVIFRAIKTLISFIPFV
jgi:phage-related protein